MGCASLQVCLLWTTLLLVQHTQQAPTVTVKNGQELADTLRDFGTTGKDETIIVSPPPESGPRVVALENVTFVNASLLPPNSFTAGTVTVQGDTSTAAQMVVIDAAQRAGITPMFTGSAHLVLRDLGFINLCELRIPMDRAQTVWFTTGFNMGIFTRTRVYQSHTYYNLTLYGTYQDMVTQVYIGIVQKSSFDKVIQLSTPVTEDTPPTEAVFSVITPTMYRMNYSIPAAQIYNVTYKSIADPDDPLLQRMRAEGKILPVRYCNGTLIGPPHSTEEVDPFTGPLFIADTPSTSVVALMKAANMSGPSAKAEMIPPATMLLSNVSLTSDLLPGSVSISGPMLLMGPVYNDPSNLLLTRLDFQGRQGVIQLTGGSQLFMQQLIFDGLSQHPLPPLLGAQPTTHTSALPLAGISSDASPDTWPTDPPLWMHESVMVLPTDDYLALLSLATQDTQDSLSGCMDTSIAARTDALSKGITRIELSSQVQPPFQHLLLSNFVGWGILGTAMELVPADPQAAAAGLAGCVQQFSVAGTKQTPSSSSSSKGKGGLSSGAVAGVVVGSVVGGVCVLLLLAVVWVHLHRHRAAAAQKAQAYKMDTEQPAVMPPRDSSSGEGSLQEKKVLALAGAAAGTAAAAAAGTTPGATDWHQPVSSYTIGMVRAMSGGYGPKTAAGASLLQLVKHAEQQQASRLLGPPTVQVSSTTEHAGLYSTGITNASMPGAGASKSGVQLYPLASSAPQPEGIGVENVGATTATGIAGSGPAGGSRLGLRADVHGSGASPHGLGAAQPAIVNLQGQAHSAYGKSAPLLGPGAASAATGSRAGQQVLPSAISAVDGHTAPVGGVTEQETAAAGVRASDVVPTSEPEQNLVDVDGQPEAVQAIQAGAVHGRLASSTTVAPGTTSNLSSTLLQPSEAGGSSTGGLAILGYIILSPGTYSSGTEPVGPRSAFSQQMQSRTGSVSQDANKVIVRGVLGKGSWGTVYEGEWRGLAVAVKTLVFELMSDEVEPSDESETAKPNQQVRAIMEAAIAASVGHRNLVCTYCYDIKPVRAPHAGTCHGGLQIEENFQPGKRGVYTYKLFLVQELCGVSLAHALHVQALNDAETGLIDQAVVVHLLLDIARGLHYLHTRSIIHGDLKPANVLLKTDSGTELAVCAKLADFGLSSYMEEGATHVSDFSAGTPFYVAPEVIKHRRISTASDIYSFGVLMWQLFTGTPPYQQDADGTFKANPLFGRYGPKDPPPQPIMWLQHRCLRHEPHA